MGRDSGSLPIDAARPPPADAAPVPTDARIGPAGCGTGSPEAFMACLDRERYLAHLSFVTGVRNPGSTHWSEVQDHCAQSLTDSGFRVERFDYGSGVDVLGVLDGTTRVAEKVLLGAHYDHLSGCDGADDNATGVAGVLEIARVLASGPHERTLVVACWDEEETGYVGSVAHATRASLAHEQIVVVYDFDMIGFTSSEPGSRTMPAGFDRLFPTQTAVLAGNGYRGDFVFVLFDGAAQPYGRMLETYAGTLGRHAAAYQLPQALQSVGELRRSDHASYWDRGFPAVFIGDTAEYRNPNYHCRGGADSIDTLDHAFTMQVLGATTGSLVRALAATEPSIEPGPGIATCAELCARAASFTTTQVGCMSAALEAAGVTGAPAACSSPTSVASCGACISGIGLAAADCEGLADLCL